MRQVVIKIHGDVQDVGFRYEAKRMADEFNIKGFVRNESDGSVYLEAEGEEKELEKFLEWCRRGPRFSRVEKVDFEIANSSGHFSDFVIE